MLNNSLPLLAALAGAAAGEPPGGHEPVADVGFLDAFLGGSLIQLVVFLPFLLIASLALWQSGVWERRVIREELPRDCLLGPGCARDRDRGTPHGAAPPTPPGIRVAYLGGSTG